MKAHLLAKLTPHGHLPNGEGFGGKARLTALDVAGALGMPARGRRLSRGAYLLGLAKYALDTDAAVGLVRIVSAELGRRAIPLPSTLATIAVFEVIDASRCPACNGTGEPFGQTCEYCGGSGQIPPSIRSRARLAGIPKSTWVRKYESASREAYKYVAELENELLTHLEYQFRG